MSDAMVRSPSSVLDGVDLAVERRCLSSAFGKRDAEEAQAVAAGRHGVGPARLVLVERDPKAMDLRLVERRGGPLQQRLEARFRLVEGAREILALGRFEVQREHQLVVRVASGTASTSAMPLLEVIERRAIGRGRSWPCVPPRDSAARASAARSAIGDEIAADVQVIDDRRRSDRPGPSASKSASSRRPTSRCTGCLLRVRDQAVGGLLHAVVQERIDGSRAGVASSDAVRAIVDLLDQAGLQRLGQTACRLSGDCG